MRATKLQCAICFQEIANKLLPASQRSSLFSLQTESKDHQAPLFVTWKIQSDLYDSIVNKRTAAGKVIGSDDEDDLWELRGCIGVLSPINLNKGIPEYAKIAAFEDTRFSPINKGELSKLKCNVSLLVDFEPAKTPTDWEVGKHGILLTFEDSKTKKKYRGTFLPEVAKEQGWDQVTTLKHLFRKAGVPASLYSTAMTESSVVRYQSSKVSMTYQEYLAFKQQSSMKQAESNASP